MFQDQDTFNQPDDSSLMISIQFKQETEFNMRETSTVGDLIQKFCSKMDIDYSMTRLLLNGERLDEKLELNMLELQDDDIIEAFSECIGGGPIPKKILLNSEKQILNALDESYDGSESDEGPSEEKLEETNVKNDNLSKEKEKDAKDSGAHTEIKINEETSLDKELVSLEASEETRNLDETNDDEWMENVRTEFEKGNLKGNSSLHKQLTFYMKLPEIKRCEKNIVKTLLERIQIHSEWEAEKIT